MHPLFKLYLNGVSEKGKGGLIFKKQDHATYMFPSEFADHKFGSSMKTLIEEPVNTDVFFIVEEKDGQAVVRAYNMQSIISDAGAAEPT